MKNALSVGKIAGMGLLLSLTLGLSACKNDKTEQTQSSTNNTSASSLPTLKVVTDAESPPMTFMDERGNIQGIDIDVIRAIGENQGFNVEIHRDAFVNIFDGLESGKYQVAISSLSLTPERAGKYGHSEAYLYNPAIVMHSQAPELQDINELKPLRVATPMGTMFESIIKEVNPAQLDTPNTNFQAYQGLLQERFDAIMGDKYILEYMLARHPHKQLNSFEYKIGDGSSANMVIYTKKDDQELIDKLNQGIAQLKQAGKIDGIVQNYLANSKG